MNARPPGNTGSGTEPTAKKADKLARRLLLTNAPLPTALLVCLDDGSLWECTIKAVKGIDPDPYKDGREFRAAVRQACGLSAPPATSRRVKLGRASPTSAHPGKESRLVARRTLEGWSSVHRPMI